MGQQSNDTDRQKCKYSKKSLYLCLFVHYKSRIEGLGTNLDLRDETTAINGLKMWKYFEIRTIEMCLWVEMMLFENTNRQYSKDFGRGVGPVVRQITEWIKATDDNMSHAHCMLET
jgi:hypothetical protein